MLIFIICSVYFICMLYKTESSKAKSRQSLGGLNLNSRKSLGGNMKNNGSSLIISFEHVCFILILHKHLLYILNQLYYAFLLNTTYCSM